MTLKLFKIKQSFSDQLAGLGNVPDEVRQALRESAFSVKPRTKIAIAVGSRGVANLPAIVKTVARYLVEWGAKPFVVPAMGSHGGATAEGQQALLQSLGISDKTVGVPVCSSMDVVSLEANGLGHALYMDRLAYESDGVVLINRIKPHTDFRGRYESGLVKMSVIGLGKHAQALEMHRLGVAGLRDQLAPTAERILSTGKILLGLALVENASEQTVRVEALPPNGILEREPELLELARAQMPRLPVDDIDVLIVDRMGKDISGTGMDTNIVGRMKIRGQPEPESPRVKALMVTDLTDASHGNAVGMGFADVITRRLAAKIDFPVMYENVITATFLDRGKMPVVAETAQKAYEIALRACGAMDGQQARVLRIQDTLHLEEVYVSASVFEKVRGETPPFEEGEEMFQSDGELVPFR